jgi:ABC-type nitrate/sulfonate/bicarbonate transport system permease component
MDSTTLVTAWEAWQLPLLPELSGQSLARHGLWAVVLGGGVGWLTSDWSRRLRLALLVTVLVWVALPGAASISHWLGLAFKAPSLSSGLLGLFWLVKALRSSPADAIGLAGPAPWSAALGWLAVLLGWLLGSALGFGVALAIDRQPFLQRGLLPLASLTSTIPLVAVAPIAVMWFGFEWPSKAAVVVLMTFFPMLVSTLAGLQASGKLERELMHSYAASYGGTLLALRLPVALPFMFGALKINASLALIGAIVAEFFGSPTSGLGFRISSEAARMNMPLVWGAIVVAAVTGSLAYTLLLRLERRFAFWHPSVREAVGT